MAFQRGSSGSLLYEVEVPRVISRWCLRSRLGSAHKNNSFQPTFVIVFAGMSRAVKETAPAVQTAVNFLGNPLPRVKKKKGVFFFVWGGGGGAGTPNGVDRW